MRKLFFQQAAGFPLYKNLYFGVAQFFGPHWHKTVVCWSHANAPDNVVNFFLGYWQVVYMAFLAYCVARPAFSRHNWFYIAFKGDSFYCCGGASLFFARAAEL